MSIDLLIQGGSPFVDDVALCNGRIVDVGNIDADPAVETLDATRCVVTPGFFDIHSYSDFMRAVSSVTQGVTLEVVDNSGHGCAPLGDPQLTRSNIYGCCAEDEIHWCTVAEYRDLLEKCEPGVNVATLVSNGNLRLVAVGLVDQPSMWAELRTMKKIWSKRWKRGHLAI